MGNLHRGYTPYGGRINILRILKKLLLSSRPDDDRVAQETIFVYQAFSVQHVHTTTDVILNCISAIDKETLLL